MEAHGENRSEIGSNQQEEDVYDIHIEFKKLLGILPQTHPDDPEYLTHVELWKTMLGVHPSRWTGDKDKAANQIMHDEALKNRDKYEQDMKEYSKQIEELNNDLGQEEEEFSDVEILPRSPSPRCLDSWLSWHQNFRMTNTNPTSIKSGRFTDPNGDYEYVSSDLLQFFSMRFVGDFTHGEKKSIYGFLAVRDNIDQLRNYIFNRSRENAQLITQDSPNLMLIPPRRGISGPYDVIVEYCLKLKGSGADASQDDDAELMDGCFMFRHCPMDGEVQQLKVRLFGPLGPLDIRFAYLRFAVEATIEIKVKRVMPGYSLNVVTARTCGYPDSIMLYDSSEPSHPRVVGDGGLSSSVVVVQSAVVAVELGCNLKLRFEITGEEESSYGLGGHARTSSHELVFAAQRYSCSKESVVMGGMFKASARVTWSTMGKRFHPIFDGRSMRSVLGDPDGPCCWVD